MAENEEKIANNNENDSTGESEQLQPTGDFIARLPSAESEQLNEVQNSCQKIMEKQNEQEQFNKEIVENQKKLLNELFSMQNFNKELLEKVENQRNLLEGLHNGLKEVKENQKIVEPSKTIIQAPEIPQKQHQASAPSKFIVRNVLKNVSKMEEDRHYDCADEEHFGVAWNINVTREKEHLSVFLHCRETVDDGKWSIDVESVMKIIHPNGTSITKNFSHCFNKYEGRGFRKFIKWEDLLKDYLVGDKLTVEAHVNIIKMTGIYKEDLRSFDQSTEEFSDVVLNVKDEKFYVLRKYLAAHSSYFKALFLGHFNESEQTEVILSGIDAFDFQNYLEVLYGYNAIDEMTVEGILLVADMYDTEIVTRKCEEFLINESDKDLKKLLQLSVRYNLENLKENCLSDIESIADIHSVIPGDIRDLDPAITTILLEKSLSFNCLLIQ